MFAGASQFVAADTWTQQMTLAAILTLTIVMATVTFALCNLRFAPSVARRGVGATTYPPLALLTSLGWLMSTHCRRPAQRHSGPLRAIIL